MFPLQDNLRELCRKTATLLCAKYLWNCNYGMYGQNSTHKYSCQTTTNNWNNGNKSRFFFFIMLAKKMMEIADRFFFHGKKYVCSDCFSQFYQEIRSCKDVHKNKPQLDYLLSFQTSSYNKLYRYAKCMLRIKM